MNGAKALILGAAQDAGVPQMGCHCGHCAAARRDPAAVQYAAALGLQGADGRCFLLDATPDIRAQAGMLPRLDGILLTHGHIGHYTGLMHLGREAMGARGVPVWGTPQMLKFLRTNAPWEQLVRLGNIELAEVCPGVSIRLADGLTVEPFSVTHRAEYTDTVGYLIKGRDAAVMYVPDVDRWDFDLREMVSAVDVALLDGTFSAADDLPPEIMRVVGHPPMTETVATLAAGGLAERVQFTHINHSSPAWNPASAIRGRITEAGAAIARQGAVIPL